MFERDYDRGMFYTYHKLSNGQTAFMGFFECGWEEHQNYFSVCLAIANKKKQIKKWLNEQKGSNITLQSTGKTGLESFFWARKTILEFENFILDYYPKNEIRIYIEGEDRRRYKSYKSALEKYGYKEILIENKFVLMKKLREVV